MLLGQVFRSIASWQKLSSVNMKPAIAYKILKYTKLVIAEHEVAEKQRVALVHEITNTKDGENALIEPDTPEFIEYVEKLDAIMLQEVNLDKLDFDLDTVVNALSGKDDVLSVSDLAMLEPFFAEEVASLEPVEEA